MCIRDRLFTTPEELRTPAILLLHDQILSRWLTVPASAPADARGKPVISPPVMVPMTGKPHAMASRGVRANGSSHSEVKSLSLIHI